MYTILYACRNCGHVFTREFPKGKKACDIILCPVCDCSEACKIALGTLLLFWVDPLK